MKQTIKKFLKLPRWVWSIWFFICHLVEPIDTNKSIAFRVKIGQINEDLSPKRCLICGHDEFEDDNHVLLDTYGSTVLEHTTKCKRCEALNGIWAQGSWMP